MRTEQAGALADPAAISVADPGGMLTLAASLGSQLREGFDTARSTGALPSPEGLRSIALCGMGGSGVAGDVVRSLYADRLPIPVAVVKGYRLPEFCGRDSLVVAVSFSGNTEETLAAYREAASRGCRLVTVCAGGELAALSEADEVARVPVPAQVPVPRAALGYLAAAPIGILDAMGLVPPAEDTVAEAAGVLEELAAAFGPDRTAADNEAKAIALWLAGRTPVVWGSEGLAEAAALRWKTQLNENPKIPAWAGVLPELDHNEVEGWSDGAGTSYGVVILRHPGEHPRTGPRVDATLQAIATSGLEARQVRASGSGPLSWLLSLIMAGDFASTYLAIARGVDPMPVPVLASLKERLRA